MIWRSKGLVCNKVWAIDTRGHGKTPRGDMPFTIRQFADDLLVFMDEHQIEKAHLLGFSDGGNIAMVFAIQYPNRVNRLILNGANLNADGVKRTTQIPIDFIASKQPEEFNRAVLSFLRK